MRMQPVDINGPYMSEEQTFQELTTRSIRKVREWFDSTILKETSNMTRKTLDALTPIIPRGKFGCDNER